MDAKNDTDDLLEAFVTIYKDKSRTTKLKDHNQFMEVLKEFRLTEDVRRPLMTALDQMNDEGSPDANEDISKGKDQPQQQWSTLEPLWASYWPPYVFSLVLLLAGVICLCLPLIPWIEANANLLKFTMTGLLLTVLGLAGLIFYIRPIQNELSRKSAGDNQLYLTAEIQKALLEPFGQMRSSFVTSLLMSILLFIIGLVLIYLAVGRSSGEANLTVSTFVIAGLGIADFVLLFYTRPWQDVSKNLGNAVQIRMVTLSYFMGVALIQKKEEDKKVEQLQKLTKESVSLIQKYAEERDEPRRESGGNNGQPDNQGPTSNPSPAVAAGTGGSGSDRHSDEVKNPPTPPTKTDDSGGGGGGT